MATKNKTSKKESATTTKGSTKKELAPVATIESEKPNWAKGKREVGKILGFTEVGQMYEGEFVKLEIPKKKGKSAIIYLKDFATKRIRQVFSSFQLNQQLADVKAGTKVRIVFVGVLQLKSGRTLKEFDVWTDEQ